MDIDNFNVLIGDDLKEVEVLIERYLLEKDEKQLKKIYKMFHIIKGIAGFTELEIIYELTKYTEKLIELIIKLCKREDKNEETDSTLIVELIISYELIKRIKDNRFKFYDREYIESVKEHIDLINGSIEKARVILV